ncbi:1961_t:CDS:2 [Paraglomus brasilianum]|uniref:1961_t:CDS:1 n=1 Tax=Paraglomus brasilianum TaxID=144538 RepID=A0A9N8ZF45_9GLOM|nr:1961_t:CDS:2 [Paraglomus brasilianum]
MVDWTDAQTRILINERRNRNEEYHNLGKVMCEYMNGSRTARRSRNILRSHFWENPEDPFDRIRNMNISNCRRGRGIVSPAPSIEVVEQVLGQRTSSRRSRSRRNQRSRTRSESSSRNEDGNTGNPARGGNNTTTSSVQPPSYEASTSNQQSSNSAEGIQMVSGNIMRNVSRLCTAPSVKYI